MSNLQRPNKVTFRLSSEELAQLKKRIEDSGLSSQSYLLSAALNSSVTDLQPILLEMKRTRTELNRVGNNLNQLMRFLNSTHDRANLRDVELLISEIRKAIKEVTAAWLSLRR